MAATQQFGLSAQLLPLKSIPAVFEDVARGRSHYGVVPVENSTEGGGQPHPGYVHRFRSAGDRRDHAGDFP